MKDKILKTDDLTRLSYPELMEAIRNGYELYEIGKEKSLQESSQERILDVQMLRNIPIENLIILYKNGFKVNEGIGLSGLSTCPQTVNKGSSKNFNLTVTTEGKSPYTYKLYRDDIVIDSYGPVNDKSHVFVHVFNESAGTYIISADVTDSCPFGPETSPRISCQFTVVSTTPTVTQPTGTGTQPTGTGTQPTGTLPTGVCSSDFINIFGKCIRKENVILYGTGVTALGLLGFAAYKESRR